MLLKSASRRPKVLRVAVGGGGETPDESKDASFNITDGFFVKGDVAISGTGVAMRDNPKAFTVVPETLQVGAARARGATPFAHVCA